LTFFQCLYLLKMLTFVFIVCTFVIFSLLFKFGNYSMSAIRIGIPLLARCEFIIFCLFLRIEMA